MHEKKFFLTFIFAMLSISIFLIWKSKKNDTYLLNNLVNPRLIDESMYYQLYCDDEYQYVGIIFNKNGDVVFAEQFSRSPYIEVYPDNILGFSVQAGTGRATKWTFFYDIENDNFSNVFYSVFQKYEDKIVYGDDYYSVVVRNIFNEDEFYQKIEDFKNITQKAADPIVDATFVNNGQNICITYLNEEYEEIDALFDLPS